MYAGCTFETTEPALSVILDKIHQGAIQLPDFQRGWIWDDEHIRSLLASVSLSYPIGAIMLLETGGDGIRFKPRAMEGAEFPVSTPPEKLILDGQQRLTSLYLSLRSLRPVPTRTNKGEDIERFYFADMRKCLDTNEDRIDAIVSLPPEKMLRSDFGRTVDLDLSTREKEYENSMVPFGLFFDSTEFMKWRQGYASHHGNEQEKTSRLMQFENQVWLAFQQYRIPVIELKRQTPKEAVCQVFEKVNTGGVTLSVFELLTATFAADDFNLRDDWKQRVERLHNQKVLEDVDATAFLTAITLYASFRRKDASSGYVSCKRKDVLNLTLDDYKTFAQEIEDGFLKCALFLAREKVFDTRSLPYSSQLVPLCAIMAALGGQSNFEPVKKKLARWYWCGVFGELYGGASETRFALDLPDVVQWINGGREPRTVLDSSFSPVRLLSLHTRVSAAYKGIMAQLMRSGSQDFLTGDTIELTTYFDRAIDIHHVFPRAYCEKSDIPQREWNCIVNKAALSATTNRIIGSQPPSSYLTTIEKKGITQSRLDEILRSHVIEPSALYGDDFRTFFRTRALRMLDLIEGATVKQVQGRDSQDVIDNFGAPLTRGE